MGNQTSPCCQGPHCCLWAGRQSNRKSWWSVSDASLWQKKHKKRHLAQFGGIMEGCLEEVIHKLRPEGQRGISLVKVSGVQVNLKPRGGRESMTLLRAQDRCKVGGAGKDRVGWGRPKMRLKKPAGARSWTMKGLPSHILCWIPRAAIWSLGLSALLLWLCQRQDGG